MSNRRVFIDVGRIVLCGLSQREAAIVEPALRRELARLLSEPGSAAQLSRKPSIENLKVPGTAISPGDHTRRIGAHIGRSIARGIAK